MGIFCGPHFMMHQKVEDMLIDSLKADSKYNVSEFLQAIEFILVFCFYVLLSCRNDGMMEYCVREKAPALNRSHRSWLFLLYTHHSTIPLFQHGARLRGVRAK
jgi:hypothetical protein